MSSTDIPNPFGHISNGLDKMQQLVDQGADRLEMRRTLLDIRYANITATQYAKDLLEKYITQSTRYEELYQSTKALTEQVKLLIVSRRMDQT